MPLYEVSWGIESEIFPSDLENKLRKKYNTNKINFASYAKMIRTIDNELNSLKPSARSRLVFTKAGALVGHKSKALHCDLTHLWECAIAVYGEDKVLKKFIGTLVMWRISLRNDIWLVCRQEDKQKRVDPDTGEEFKICEYWIDNSYQYPNKPKTVQDLVDKFNTFKKVAKV